MPTAHPLTSARRDFKGLERQSRDLIRKSGLVRCANPIFRTGDAQIAGYQAHRAVVEELFAGWNFFA
jgi:hypothetical protein